MKNKKLPKIQTSDTIKNLWIDPKTKDYHYIDMDCTNLLDAAKRLTDLHSALLNNGYTEAIISIDTETGYCHTSFSVSAYRQETEEEYEDRIRKDEERKKQVELDEKKLLETLQKKYKA
jgi:hypothetical protein